MNKSITSTIIILSLILTSGKHLDIPWKKYTKVYQCNRQSDGSSHFLIFNSINEKHSGYYLGSEISMKVLKNSIEYDTVFYFTELNNLIFLDDGQLRFKVKPTDFYTEPFVIDSMGNLVKRPRIKTNNISIDLTMGYSFFGEYHGNVIELQRVSPLYFSRSDHFYFTALQ